MRRQRPLDAADAAADIEHIGVCANEPPFAQPQDDLGGRTVEDFW